MDYIQRDGANVTVFASASVTSAATAYSDPVETTRREYFGIWVNCEPASAGDAAGINMWYEESYDTTAANFVSAGAIATASSALSAVPALISLSPIPAKFIRFGIDCGAGGETDLVVSATLYVQ